MTRVPTGFVPQDSVELDPDGQFDPASLEGLTKLPCTLYTDSYGMNMFVLELDGVKYFMPAGTD